MTVPILTFQPFGPGCGNERAMIIWHVKPNGLGGVVEHRCTETDGKVTCTHDQCSASFPLVADREPLSSFVEHDTTPAALVVPHRVGKHALLALYRAGSLEKVAQIGDRLTQATGIEDLVLAVAA